MVLYVKAEYEDYRIRNYLFNGYIDLELDKNVLKESITLKNYLSNSKGRKGFTEIDKYIEVMSDVTRIHFKFRLNTWLPISQDLVFDNMSLKAEWDYEKEDGFLYVDTCDFNIKFPNKKLRKYFSGKSENKNLKLQLL